MNRKHVVVVGAGIGGLATAARMAHRGHRVTVLEKTNQIGGRNRPVQVNDCHFDGGPTLMMMLDPFRRLFTDLDTKLEDHLDIQLMDPSYRVFYADGSRIDGTTNVARMVEQIQKLSGREDSLAYPKMLGDLADLYRTSVPNFVEKNFYSAWDFFGGKALRHVQQHRMLGNLAKGIARYVKDPKLQMLFSFQTMYLGLSPFQAPWVYAVLTYMEYGEGIWYPKGGMVEIANAIARIAEAKGCTIELNSAVAAIDGNRVTLSQGSAIEADAVICNADLPYAQKTLLKRQPKVQRSSCSAYMMYIDYEGNLPTLEHHNVFFGRDFYGNLNQIFSKLEIPEDPAFYACVSCRSDQPKAPQGHENLFILVPCPNLDHAWSSADANRLTESVYRRLECEIGFDRQAVKGLKTYSPVDWANDLNLDRGAAFGLSHDFWQSAYFRPSNRDRQNPFLYYVGASTVPGNGLPMVLISAQLAEERLIRELGC